MCIRDSGRTVYARQSDTTSDGQKSDDGDRSEECIGKDVELPCIDGRRNGSCGDKQDQQAEEEGRGDVYKRQSENREIRNGAERW